MTVYEDCHGTYTTYLFKMSDLSQQQVVNMKKPGVFTGSGFDPEAWFPVIVFVTRILRTFNVHFEGSFKVPIASTTVA